MTTFIKFIRALALATLVLLAPTAILAQQNGFLTTSGENMTDVWIDPSSEITGMLFTQSADGMKYQSLQEFRELIHKKFCSWRKPSLRKFV